MSNSNKGPGVDYRLQNLTNALYVDGNNDVVVRTGFAGNIVISGNVNIPGTVNVASSPTDPVHVHLTEVGTFGNLTTFVPVQGNIIVTGGNANVTVVGNISGITTLPAISGNVGVSGNVSITTMPGVAVTSMPEVEIKNDSGNPIPVSANTTVNSLANPISIQITKNGLAVSDTVGLPTRVINDEALISYARGKAVTEADVLNAFLIDKSGSTETLGTSPETMSTVWEGSGLYPWNTYTGTGARLYIKSVTNDPKIQGKSITINGLDSNYDIIEETVTLHPTDTTTAVSTSLNFYRINRIYLSGANTNSLPHDYDLEVRYGSTSGTLLSLFVAPWGRGQNCIYTVPRGYEAFVLSINGNSGHSDEITSSLWWHPYGGTWTLQKSFKFISGSFDHNFRTPLRIPEKSDIEIRAYALIESSRIGTEFQILVLPKA